MNRSGGATPALTDCAAIASATHTIASVVARRAALELAIEPLREAALRAVEAHTVDGVHDDRHAGAVRGVPAENARLAAVRVDDVELPLAKQPGQFARGTNFAQRA